LTENLIQTNNIVVNNIYTNYIKYFTYNNLKIADFICWAFCWHWTEAYCVTVAAQVKATTAAVSISQHMSLQQHLGTIIINKGPK